jgi:hypothetical protein
VWWKEEVWWSAPGEQWWWSTQTSGLAWLAL